MTFGCGIEPTPYELMQSALGSAQAIARSQATAQAIVRKYRTSVKYTRTTDEMATSYHTSTAKFRHKLSYDRTTACGDSSYFYVNFTIVR
jgi:hypothetical protein